MASSLRQVELRALAWGADCALQQVCPRVLMPTPTSLKLQGSSLLARDSPRPGSGCWSTGRLLQVDASLLCFIAGLCLW